MKALYLTIGLLAGLFLLLAIPSPEPQVPLERAAGGFAWNRDDYWRGLEARYAAARARGCEHADSIATGGLLRLEALHRRLLEVELEPQDPLLDSVETGFFEVGPYVAACPAHLPEYERLAARLREGIKWQSAGWDVTSPVVRARLYRSLYGFRGAVEEVMLQHPDRVVPLLMGVDEPSATPGTVVQGVTIHSGDMLVSRGGYPTSALIARGNDYPGNFSHVALAYVDSATGNAYTIEAHIERGVAISTAEEYLADKKLRIMVMRPRADLPAVAADPMLPHRAALAMFQRAREGHIPYDFAMDYSEPSRLFCSEVASAAYARFGIRLWMGISTISSPGLRRWLASFGVRHFETQEPSDLEYDPQLVVVAEWRDGAALRGDHIDNAVIDAMLEGAEAGDRLSYPWYQLPLVRVAKGWSWILERFGKVGPVPEGMSAAAALRNKAFSERQRRLATMVTAAADSLARQQGYPPPYWILLDLARAAAGIEPR